MKLSIVMPVLNEADGIRTGVVAHGSATTSMLCWSRSMRSRWSRYARLNRVDRNGEGSGGSNVTVLSAGRAPAKARATMSIVAAIAPTWMPSLVVAGAAHVEPSGALAVAALLSGRIPKPGRVGVILSGGNIDVQRFNELTRNYTT